MVTQSDTRWQVGTDVVGTDTVGMGSEGRVTIDWGR